MVSREFSPSFSPWRPAGTGPCTRKENPGPCSATANIAAPIAWVRSSLLHYTAVALAYRVFRAPWVMVRNLPRLHSLRLTTIASAAEVNTVPARQLREDGTRRRAVNASPLAG